MRIGDFIYYNNQGATIIGIAPYCKLRIRIEGSGRILDVYEDEVERG